MRKIVFILSSALMLFGMAIPAASAAVSHPRAAAPSASHALLHETATPAVSCPTSYIFFENYFGGLFWSDPSSPFTIDVKKNVSPTHYCVQGSPGDFQFVQNGTERCLYLQTSSRHIIEGNCSSAFADWNVITVPSGTYAGDTELQSAENRACVWQDGLGDPATYNPCNAGNSGDIFNLFS